MSNPKHSKNVSGSFRDPSGRLFFHEGILYRQINLVYKENYEKLIQSGLYKALADDNLLIPHEEVSLDKKIPECAFKIIKPEMIPFISYPYEWSFSQLKHAALLTLDIQKKAIEYGMSLKDCSAYNIQFRQSRPVFIDTLSFEEYIEGQPWVAYRQFCQHFLAPLSLMSYKDIRLNQLFRIYLDGVPLDLASNLLPVRTKFKFSFLIHLHLHAKSYKHFSDKKVKISSRRVSRRSLFGLIDSLASAIKQLKWQPQGTEWSDYYDDTNYAVESIQHKKQLVSEFLDKINPEIVWDLGANVGTFSHIPGDKGTPTISFDNDPAAVEKFYLECSQNKNSHILPLIVDLTNPSPGLGWNHEERMSLIERGPADTALVLALIHHLVIGNNVPFNSAADFLSRICNSLIIEFVPKHDSQVQRLLVSREDIFTDYTKEVFEQEFSKYFKINNFVRIKDTERTLYFMVKRK